MDANTATLPALINARIAELQALRSEIFRDLQALRGVDGTVAWLGRRNLTLAYDQTNLELDVLSNWEGHIPPSEAPGSNGPTLVWTWKRQLQFEQEVEAESTR